MVWMRQASATTSRHLQWRTDAPAFSAALAAMPQRSVPSFSIVPANSCVTIADARRLEGVRQQVRAAGHGGKPARHVLDAGREQADGVERPGKAFDADGRQHPVATA